MLGKWEAWNATSEPAPYGLSDSYRLGAEWLAGCDLIEDWGCGRGYLREFVPADRYRGIDGSRSPWADVVADLREYRSSVQGVFMRHVLEHNPDWRLVLGNAVASFTRRMALVLFTPEADTTRQVGFSDDLGVPDLAFAAADLEPFFAGIGWTRETFPSPGTQYGVETLYRLIRHGDARRS